MTSRYATSLRRVALVLLIAVLSGIIGEAYSSAVYGDLSDDYYPGFRSGFTIGLVSASIEIFYIRTQRRSWIRRVSFLPGFIVRILVITLIIRVCLLGNQLLTKFLAGNKLVERVDTGDQVRDTLVSLAVVIVFVILSQLTSIIGFRRFMNLVIGRYFRPVTEERVFLFVDLVDSSNLARKLGNQRFHEYLSEFFHQLDRAIVRNGGEIVSYIGDAVIVTWPIGKNQRKNARCLRTLRLMLDVIEKEKVYFETQFGIVPEFRAALHGGEVVVGECGDSRRQVTFLGDVVNVTSRIESLTKEVGEQFLASTAVLKLMKIPPGVEVEPLGEKVLRGSVEPIELNRIVFT